jgi:hypothetical protein
LSPLPDGETRAAWLSGVLEQALGEPHPTDLPDGLPGNLHVQPCSEKFLA